MGDRRSASRRRQMLAALALTAGALVAPGNGQAVAAPTAPTAPAGDGIEMVDLPAGLQVHGLNDRGEVVGRLGAEVVVVDDGAVTGTVAPWQQFRSPLCPEVICFFPEPIAALINDRGVVGTAIGGHASLWDDGEVTDLNGDAQGSWLLGLNDRGQALVMRFMTDHLVVGVWHRGELTTIGTWGLDTFVVGHLSERGHVVLTALTVQPPTPTVEVLFWHRGVTTEIEGFAPADVNRRGQVAGQTFDPASPWSSQPAVWDGGRLTPLPTFGGTSHGASFINDRGQVVGSSSHPGVEPTAVLWEDGEIVDVGASVGDRLIRAIGLSESGQILLTGFSAEFDATGAVWEDGEVHRLPPSGETGFDVQPHALNDRDQVVGYRRGPGPSVPSIATLWELP